MEKLGWWNGYEYAHTKCECGVKEYTKKQSVVGAVMPRGAYNHSYELLESKRLRERNQGVHVIPLLWVVLLL